MNKRFLSFLIIFGTIVLALWVLFAWAILPLLPTSLSGGLAMLGYGVIFVMAALVSIWLYERTIPDDDEL